MTEIEKPKRRFTKRHKVVAAGGGITLSTVLGALAMWGSIAPTVCPMLPMGPASIVCHVSGKAGEVAKVVKLQLDARAAHTMDGDNGGDVFMDQNNQPLPNCPADNGTVDWKVWMGGPEDNNWHCTENGWVMPDGGSL